LNCTTCKEFFLLLERVVNEFKIAPKNTYNMGVMMGLGQKTFVLADCNQASVNVIEDGNWELVTVIECISVNDRDLNPTVIFKGFVKTWLGVGIAHCTSTGEFDV
jgi:hypothetical protein